MFLKLIKTTQIQLIFWHLLGALINKVLIKDSKFILHSLYFLKKLPKNVCYFRIYYVVLINKSAYKKLKQQVLGITKRGNKGITNQGRFQRLQIGALDYKLEHEFQIGAKGFQIGAEITILGKRDQKQGQVFQTGTVHGLTKWLIVRLPTRRCVSLIHIAVTQLKEYLHLKNKCQSTDLNFSDD